MPALVVALRLVLAAAGLAVPNAPALALSGTAGATGTAAALLGAVQPGVGAIAAPLVGVLGAVAMGLVISGALLAANAVLLLVVRPWQPTASARPYGRAPTSDPKDWSGEDRPDRANGDDEKRRTDRGGGPARDPRVRAQR